MPDGHWPRGVRGVCVGSDRTGMGTVSWGFLYGLQAYWRGGLKCIFRLGSATDLTWIISSCKEIG